jgi:hypothetical protein
VRYGGGGDFDLDPGSEARLFCPFLADGSDSEYCRFEEALGGDLRVMANTAGVKEGYSASAKIAHLRRVAQ